MMSSEVVSDDLSSLSACGFIDVLASCSREELIQILHEPKEQRVFPLTVNFIALCDANPVIAHSLFQQPRTTLDSLDQSCVPAQRRLLEDEGSVETMSVKPAVRVRLEDLFYVNQNGLHCGIGDLSCEQIGRLLSFECTVVKTGELKVIGSGQTSLCPNCNNKIDQKNEEEEVYCPQCGEEIQYSALVHSDYQEIKVQQSNANLELGGVPRSISVILHDDLTDSCQVGDDVCIIGVVITRGVPRRGNSRATAEYTILANNVQKLKTQTPFELTPIDDFAAFWRSYERQPMAGRSSILSWMCPQIHGQYKTKLALLLVLIGGNQSDESPVSRRNLHLLLIGDPGTGKSQFMKFASLISSRCVITNGRGSTSAGLTACAIKQDGVWSLEPGALVLADGGICCIDEFNGIQETDRAIVHEVMEQQTLSIAKGGLVTTLNARTSVFGCMNPVSGQHYNSSRTLSENSGLSWPLISRFDVIFLVSDDREHDVYLADHILNFHRNEEVKDNDLTVRRLREYIDWIKHRFNPFLTEEANRILKKYYQQLRQRKSRLAAPKITVRALESLIRISQAHARLMARDEVQVDDALTSVLLYEASALSSGQFQHTLDHLLQSPNPDESNQQAKESLSKKLHL